MVHGIAAADGPISPVGFVPRADNTYYLPNTGGGAGPEWGPYIGVDCHGDASPYFRDLNHLTPGPLYEGMVLTWMGDGSTLPAGISFNTPFNFRAGDPGNPPSGSGITSSLDSLLSGPYGSRIDDMVVYVNGLSSAWIISEPTKSLLPFETAPADVCELGNCKRSLWNNLSAMYGQTQLVVIPANMNDVYTKYVAQNMYWPMWDPTVPDHAFYTVPNKWNSDYPDPSTWTQYNFYIQNDCVTTPEPGVLLLLGLGLTGLVSARKVVKL